MLFLQNHKRRDQLEFETRIDFAISPQFYGWLFALGPDIRVTSPGFAVNKFREYGENVMNNYQQAKRNTTSMREQGEKL